LLKISHGVSSENRAIYMFAPGGVDGSFQLTLQFLMEPSRLFNQGKSTTRNSVTQQLSNSLIQ